MLATIAKRFVHCPLACTALMLSGCNPGTDVDSTPAVSTTLKASPATVERGGTTQLTWSSAGAASCIASGAWSGSQPTSGSAQSSPLDDASNIFSLSCAGRDGSARSSIVVGARDGRQSGLDFPGSAATAGNLIADGSTLNADLVVLATGYKGLDRVVHERFGETVAQRVGPIWGLNEKTQELRNMWTRTPQPGLWFTGGAFSQCRIYSRYIALQIDAIEAGRLPK